MSKYPDMDKAANKLIAEGIIKVTCDRCGYEFKTVNESHTCQPAPPSGEGK